MSYIDSLNLLSTTKTDIKSAIENKNITVNVGLTGYADLIRQIDVAQDIETVTEFVGGMTFNGSTASDPASYEVFQLNRSYMDRMFYGCSELITCPTITVQPICCTDMFNGCKKMTTVAQLDTSKCKCFNRMFKDCQALTALPSLYVKGNSESWLDEMFYNCISLESVTFSNFENITTCTSMFYNCRALKTATGLDGSPIVYAEKMFMGCSALETCPDLDTSELFDADSMFYNCTSLTTIPELDFSSIGATGSALGSHTANMLYGCRKLTDLGGFKGLKAGIDLSQASNLTVTSIDNVIKNLGTAYSSSETITMTSTQVDQMSYSQAYITNKGFTLSIK